MSQAITGFVIIYSCIDQPDQIYFPSLYQDRVDRECVKGFFFRLKKSQIKVTQSYIRIFLNIRELILENIRIFPCNYLSITA